MDPVQQLHLDLEAYLENKQQDPVFRLLVSGWRFWPRGAASRVWQILAQKRLLLPPDMLLVVVDGACPYDGVDAYAHEWATVNEAAGHNVRSEREPASWSKYRRAAGPIRNQSMVDKGADEMVAFPQFAAPESYRGKRSGTHDCIQRAQAAGIPVRIYPWVW